MSFIQWGYKFEGWFEDPKQLLKKAGVYVIWCHRKGYYRPIDVGRSDDVQVSVLNHDRKDCWKKNCRNKILYSAYYMPFTNEEDRKRVEEDIRDKTKPPCGER